jgi:hypothetical protein
MRILKTNLLLSLRVMTSAIAFFLTIFVGAIMNADPLKLLLSSIFVYVAFHILAGYVVAPIIERVDAESTLHRRGTDVDTGQDGSKSVLFDITQNAELPFDR